MYMQEFTEKEFMKSGLDIRTEKSPNNKSVSTADTIERGILYE